MRLFAYVIGACIAVYVLQLTIVTLVIAVVLAIAIGTIVRPRDTLALVAMTAFWSLLERYPLGTLAVIAGLVCLSWIEAACRSAASQAKAGARREGEVVISNGLPRLPPP